MTNKFSERLTEFLDSECSDYDIEYSWNWNDDCNCCEVNISRYDNKIDVDFKYDENSNSLFIDMSDGNWQEVNEYDFLVKYFWMLISPAIFK
jgi:hypothetical protein